jgi:hypothetical protein
MYVISSLIVIIAPVIPFTPRSVMAPPMAVDASMVWPEIRADTSFFSHVQQTYVPFSSSSLIAVSSNTLRGSWVNMKPESASY